MTQETENNVENKRPKIKFSFVFGLFMILVYCGMAFLFVFSNLFAQQFSVTTRVIIGALLFVYGSIRAYRIIKQHND